jgi:sigma-B regulation protein RsbU (phosphoserine phosphatase)
MVRDQLMDRRLRLEQALASHKASEALNYLLDEVDAALARLNDGSYGLCDTCHDPIEPDRLIADPLVRFCLDHLTPGQQRVLEDDLSLAARIQRNLLPDRNVTLNGWDIAYHYEPAGPVSGDYCDVIPVDQNNSYFVVADVSGKGVAASMLMTHLQALFRSIIPLGLPLDHLMRRVNRLFCDSVLPMSYATLICGKINATGHVELCNAGHPPLLTLDAENATRVDAGGLPVGMFSDTTFTPHTIHLQPDDTLLIYTDGIIETRNFAGHEYGVDRLMTVCRNHHALNPPDLINTCIHDLTAFRNGAPKTDDLTMMAIRRNDEPHHHHTRRKDIP